MYRWVSLQYTKIEVVIKKVIPILAARLVSIGGLKARCYGGAERLLLRTVVEARMWIGKRDMQSCKTA